MTDPFLPVTESLTNEWMPFIVELTSRLKAEMGAAAPVPNADVNIRRAMEVLALLYLIDDRPNDELEIMTVANAVQTLNRCLLIRLRCSDKGAPYPGFWHIPGAKQQ